MLSWFDAVPGRLYVVATLLPLAAFVILLLAGAWRNLRGPAARPTRTGAYLATALMALSAVIAVYGLVLFLSDSSTGEASAARWSGRTDWVRLGPVESAQPAEWQAKPGNPDRPTPSTALALELGYKIDDLTALIFAMVAVISTAIFVFSLGYMTDETRKVVEDHLVRVGEEEMKRGGEEAPAHASVSHSPDLPHSHSVFSRRGRYGRFFLYLSLFCFSMLNLVIADNLFQVFVSWELVGVCSFFLIGFYYERPSASRAAVKAFVVNRIGDAGFIIGLLVAWTYLGTLNFEEMNRRLRSPDRDTHGPLALADQFVRVNKMDRQASTPGAAWFEVAPEANPDGTHLALFPLLWEEPDHYHGLSRGSGSHKSSTFVARPQSTYFTFDVMPYWLFVVMGLGIFLGCVGKSAQMPLHTWLPDAMEGPTPVSALIHAATMVAAGVYLVGRCFFLFAPEVLLVIAYIGAATMFISATIALVQTDIKRVLAYSTCSQLGLMMLALGIGGWVAGLLHLVTHAFFKALLFLCSGSVIHGCHHEQDLRKMGGLRAKMPLTALTMLVGVLAISGAPFFSGWYSKDLILQTALGYALVHPAHWALFALPLLTAAMTAFYMFRLWFLAFSGKPRDHHVHDHAHESPAVMTLPLVFLAVCSVGIAWGWPPWDADASALGKVLHHAEPAATAAFREERVEGHEHHLLAGGLALAAAVIGFTLSALMYWKRSIDPAAIRAKAGGLYSFLYHKWYFDEAYDATLVNPAVGLAFATAAADKRPTEGTSHGDTEPPARRFDLLTLDGWLNALGQATATVGSALRVVQTGRLRTYVMLLALTAVVLLTMLTVLTS